MKESTKHVTPHDPMGDIFKNIDPNDPSYKTASLIEYVERMINDPMIEYHKMLPEIIAFALMYAKGPCRDTSDTQYFNELEQALTDAYWEWMK